MELPIPKTPNAPRRDVRVSRGRPLWRAMVEDGKVGVKYINYTPEDVEEIDSLETLEWLFEKYNVPASQSQNPWEDVYVCMMATKLAKKLKKMRQQ